jgi:LacI family transcriptional regulator, galactose operon repressor
LAGTKRRPTVVDVAAMAGVSIASVSFVLNARDAEMRITEETRQKILGAVETLGYRPNASARELRTRRSQLLAMSIHDIQNHFYSALAVAVQEEAAAAGYDLIIFNTGHRPDREQAFLNTVLRRRVDGVITSSALTGGAETLDPLVRADVPLVALSNIHAEFHPQVDYLVNDDSRAAENAVRHLIELGHRRIGHLGGPRTLRVGRSRLEGYRAALAGAGLPIDPALEVEGTLMAHGSAEAGLLLLDAQPPPTAIFCANDAMALQVHFIIRQRGLRMPDDVALVGFDDVREATQVDPPLTTVANRSDEVGVQAVKLLVERMAMGRDQPGRIVERALPLITRESTLGRSRLPTPMSSHRRPKRIS